MKRALYVLCIGGLLAAPMFPARTNAAESQKAEAEEHHHGHVGDWMKKKLKLTDEQSKKFDAAMKAHEESAKPVHEQLEAAMRKLHGELEIEAPEKDIQAALDQMDKAQKALMAEHEKMKAAMDGILTVKQRAQMALMHSKMMSMGMMHGRMGMMMHGKEHGECGGMGMMKSGMHHDHERMSQGGDDDKDHDEKEDDGEKAE